MKYRIFHGPGTSTVNNQPDDHMLTLLIYNHALISCNVVIIAVHRKREIHRVTLCVHSVCVCSCVCVRACVCFVFMFVCMCVCVSDIDSHLCTPYFRMVLWLGEFFCRKFLDVAYIPVSKRSCV